MRPRNGLIVGALFAAALAAVLGPPPAASQDDGELGKQIYEEQCLSCHGPKGKGDGPAAKFYQPAPRDFTSGEWRYAKKGTLEEIVRIVKDGVADTAMDPLDGILLDEEIAAVARYVHDVLAPPPAEESEPAR